jgi:HEAT repeat protein
MPTSLPELIEQLSSPEPNTRALALADLVQHGSAAVPVLMEAFNTTDEGVRTQVARALAEIADPSSADTLARAVSDNNGEVRARGAQGLARMNDHRAVSALVDTINDFPDVLHDPFTLSVYELIRLGPPILPAIVPLLKSADAITRQRAFLVFRIIISNLPEVTDWEQFWQSFGSYDPDATAQERDRAADQLASWVNQRG